MVLFLCDELCEMACRICGFSMLLIYSIPVCFLFCIVLNQILLCYDKSRDKKSI